MGMDAVAVSCVIPSSVGGLWYTQGGWWQLDTATPPVFQPVTTRLVCQVLETVHDDLEQVVVGDYNIVEEYEVEEFRTEAEEFIVHENFSITE